MRQNADLKFRLPVTIRAIKAHANLLLIGVINTGIDGWDKTWTAYRLEPSLNYLDMELGHSSLENGSWRKETQHCD